MAGNPTRQAAAVSPSGGLRVGSIFPFRKGCPGRPRTRQIGRSDAEFLRKSRDAFVLFFSPLRSASIGTGSGPTRPPGHATQKPVRVFEIPILNHTTAQDAVYDPFVGSGTTLIAGETLGRPTYAMDVDPIYVEVARRRWEAFTGQTAVHLAPERAPARRRAGAR